VKLETTTGLVEGGGSSGHHKPGMWDEGVWHPYQAVAIAAAICYCSYFVVCGRNRPQRQRLKAAGSVWWCLSRHLDRLVALPQ
jgi:hypothetical protein